jgi:hypothetical protein
MRHLAVNRNDPTNFVEVEWGMGVVGSGTKVLDRVKILLNSLQRPHPTMVSFGAGNNVWAVGFRGYFLAVPAEVAELWWNSVFGVPFQP